ncbi:receptor-type tyrosine-protein phosphatase V-like isoform X2 [Vulpes vulpes]|uniref:protein-tyrosine-phosphatase n=1 Tax=Vulpes vulpes TaxID=9627 RepID=A0ABM4YH25_VULVU
MELVFPFSETDFNSFPTTPWRRTAENRPGRPRPKASGLGVPRVGSAPPTPAAARGSPGGNFWARRPLQSPLGGRPPDPQGQDAKGSPEEPPLMPRPGAAAPPPPAPGFLFRQRGDAPAGSPDTPGGAPAAVRDLRLRSPGSPSSLEASWAAAPGEQGACRLLLYHLESQTLVRNVSVPPGSLSYTFRDLRPGSEYVLEATTWAGDPRAKSSVRQWTAPVSPPQLLLRALGAGALHASWNHSAGAAGLLLVLTDLLGGTNLTAAVGRGVSSHTFLHLSPGTPHELTLCAVAGPWRAVGPHATEWTYPSAPLDLLLLPRPAALWASWRAGPGARDGYLLRLSGPAERNSTRGPGALRATFPGPLPPGHYTLELGALAGPYDAWARASAWLPAASSADSAAQPAQSNGSELPLDGLAAPAEPGRQALLYTEGAPGLPGNISVPPATALGTSGGPAPGAHSWVDIASSLRNTTRNLTDHTKPPAPRSLEVTGRGSPSDLAIGWAPAPGPREGYRVAWHQEGSQRPPGGLVDVGPESSGLTLRGLLPGSCYTVSVWAWAGSLRSSTQRTRACTLPAPPANLSLRLATRPPALTASWSAPRGGRDGFRLRLYRLGPLTLESRDTLGPEAQNFSWAWLPPGAEVLVQLVTVRGPDESSSANATGWTPPRAPPLVHVTTEGPTELRASWVPAPGARDGYQVSLYLGGGLAGSRTLAAEVGGTSFSALTPGTRYDVEVVARAGPLLSAATTASGWTSPLLPNELLVSMQAGSAVITLAWASGPLGHGACHAQLSEAGRLPWAQPLVLGQARLVLRDLTPGRNLSLSVLCQAGPLRAATHPVVLPVEPGPVEDVQCHPEATGLALTWTVPAGDVDSCVVVAEQLAVGGRAHLVFQASTSGDALLLPGLLPATSYRLGLTVLGRNGLRSRGVTLLCATSAEGWHPPDLAAAPQLEPEAGMGVLITRGMFGKDDGQIQWYGIIATTDLSLGRPPREALNHTWHDHYYGGRDSYLATLLPSPFYPGPWAVPRSWTVPVGTEDCSRTRGICNGQLKPGSRYRFSVVAFTRRSPPDTIISFSAFSEPRAGVSRAAVPLPAAVGLLAGCCLGAAALGLLCWWRAKARRADKNRFSQELTPYNLRRTHRPIPIQSFRQSYEAKSAHAHQAFFQEFEELKEVGKEQPRLEAEHPANATKNRYPHVLPYDHSRVRLSQLDGEPHSDYINASFIPGYTDPQEFIATQGPLKKTVEDFWRLVWEQQVHVIVMLTVGMENGRVLCEHYWPVGSTPVTHGHITVHLLAEEPEDEWTKREFQLQHRAQRQPRTVTQLQFTTWPDHGVPEAPSALLAFVQLAREQAAATRGLGPVLVHCSAGVGRTGTFVALWRLLQQLQEERAADVFHAVYALRLHRPLMIQTPSQYVFLHRCLLRKALEGPPEPSEAGAAGTASGTPGPQRIAVSRLAEACTRRAAHANAGFLREYALLQRILRDDADSPAPPAGREQHSPVPRDRSHLQLSPAEESPTNEILEVWLFPGGPSGHDHVVVTGPAGPKELWELVWEHGAHVLVSLCPPDTREQQSWPTETQPIVTDTVTVQWVAENVTAGWPCTLLRVMHGESGKERQVQGLLFPCWEPGRELPTTTLLPFLAAVGQCCSRDRTKPGTLLSHCRGVAQLGTFLALDQLLQQAGTECTVDVFSVALQQSQACGLMTPTLEQYMDLYHCLNSALPDGLP